MTDFKIASAFVEVDLKDRTPQQEAELRRRLERGGPVQFDTALKDPRNSAQIRQAVESGPAAKIKTEIDVQQAMKLAQAKLNELSAKKNAITLAYDADVKKAEAAIEALRKKASEKKIDVDADVAKYQAKIEQIRASKVLAVAEIDANEGKIRARMRDLGEQAGRQLGESVAQGVKSKAKDTDDALSSVAKRANAQFKALEFGVYFAGLPIAAAAAAAATAGALAGIPLLFAGIAIAASQNNPKVQKSFDDLAEHVVTRTQEMAAPLEDELIAATGKVGASFDRLAPQIGAAMEGGVDAIDPLIDGVTGFAEQAMPGFVRAIENADAPMRGWESLLKSSGSGVTDFLDNLTEGAAGSEEILSTLGGMIEDFLGGTGEVLGNLSANGGPALEDFRASLQAVYSLLESVTDEGSALYSFFSGFSGTVTAVAGAFKGLNEILGGALGPLASMLGMYKALNMISFGKLGDAIGDIGRKSKGSTPDVDGFGGGLLRSAKSAGPLIAVMAVAETALSKIQERAREGAAQLGEHGQAVDVLAGAYRASGGVFDDYVASQMKSTDLWKLASGNARALGLDVAAMTSAIGKGGAEWDSFKEKSLSSTTALIDSMGDTGVGGALKAAAFAFQQTGGSASQVNDLIDLQVGAWQRATGATDADTEAKKQQIIAALNLQGQMNSLSGASEEARAQVEAETQARREVSIESKNSAQATRELGAAYDVIGDAAASAEDKSSAFLDVLEKIKNSDFSQEASFKGINDTLREFEKGLTGVSDKLLRANGSIDTTSESGSKLFDVVTQLQGGFANAGNSMDDLLQTGVPLNEALKQTNDDLAIARERFIKAADGMGMSREAAEKLADRYGLSSEALGQWLHQQKEADLVTAGVTKSVDDLGNEIYTLPDGKTITFTAETDPARNAFYGLKTDIEKTQFVTQITANAAQAYAVKEGWWANVTGTTATAKQDADPTGAYDAVNDWLYLGNHATAVGKQAANNDPAIAALAWWKALVSSSTAWAKINADIGPAKHAWWAWQPASKTANIFTKIWGGNKDGGEIRAFADGGEAIRHFDGGGPVVGPGGPRDDKVPSMLSNGEIVINAEDAQEDRAGLLAVNAGVPPEQAFGLSTSNGSAGGVTLSGSAGGITIENMHVTIAAETVSEMQSVMDFFNTIVPAARQGASTLAGVK